MHRKGSDTQERKGKNPDLDEFVYLEHMLRIGVPDSVHAILTPHVVAGWESQRDVLMRVVQLGEVPEGMSEELSQCLLLIRRTLAPGLPHGRHLPRQPHATLEDLLPLHFHLTRHQCPPQSPEQQQPEQQQHEQPEGEVDEVEGAVNRVAAAAIAASAAEKQACKKVRFPYHRPRQQLPQQQPEQQPEHQSTPPNLRTYTPIADLERKHAHVDGNILSYMCPDARIQAARAKVSVHL